MGNRLVKALQDALRLVREEQETAGRGARGRQLAICATDLESALLRAKLACEHNGLVLLPEDKDWRYHASSPGDEPTPSEGIADVRETCAKRRAEAAAGVGFDWDRASSHLESTLDAYASIGAAGAFVAGVLNAAQARFDKGERTPELYNEIMGLE